MRILVTAGPTCEDIDAVRFITNRSSGKMGYAIAEEASRRGHAVTLVSGPVRLDCPRDVELVSVRSAAEMADKVFERFGSADAVVMTAAVADYRPKRPAAGKLKKSPGGLVLELERTVDILAELGARKAGQVLVGFALETESGRASAERKLAEKRLDMVVLNGLATLGADRISAETLAAGGGWKGPEELTKRVLAGRILDFVESRPARAGRSEAGADGKSSASDHQGARR